MSFTAALKHRRIPREKIELANEVEELARKHRSILVLDLNGVPAKHIQVLRKKLDKHAVMKVVKPKVALKGLERVLQNAKQLEKYMSGQVMLVFSNKNAFELAKMVEDFVTYDYYKPGDVAEEEIVIPEGNTGLPAGPILSVFGRLKVPTRVQGNVVYVVKDTVVAKPGDVISADLASILQKLGLALKKIRVKIKCGVDGGLVIPGEQLKLNIAEYEEGLKAAALDALKLAIELVIPEEPVLGYVLAKAEKQALALVAELGFVTPETAEHVIRVAHAKAIALALEISKYAPELGLVAGVPKQEAREAKTTKTTKEEEKKEEEPKELSEEALAEGFAALFG
ncbi:MAG: 50S ribosomal protein L10 [Desulfurococcaceae archaeon]